MGNNNSNIIEKEVKNTQKYTTISISEKNYWNLKNLVLHEIGNDVLDKLLEK